VELELFFSFLVTSVLIELTPGPNITYLALLALGEGRKAALAAGGWGGAGARLTRRSRRPRRGGTDPGL
jgi:threonine/homoserine/homoserine lactone efflux protein